MSGLVDYLPFNLYMVAPRSFIPQHQGRFDSARAGFYSLDLPNQTACCHTWRNVYPTYWLVTAQWSGFWTAWSLVLNILRCNMLSNAYPDILQPLILANHRTQDYTPHHPMLMCVTRNSMRQANPVMVQLRWQLIPESRTPSPRPSYL